MIFINFNNGQFTSADTDKRFTRMAFDALSQPLAKRLGKEWLSDAQNELDGLGNFDLSELSRDDFILACSELEKSAKKDAQVMVLFQEIEPLLKSDSRFKGARLS